MNISKINRHGQISIPASIRNHLGLKPGEFVYLEETSEGGILLHPVQIEKRGVETILKNYEASGVDISLLEQNLKRTPTERIEHHQEMLALVEEAKRAGRKMRG